MKKATRLGIPLLLAAIIVLVVCVAVGCGGEKGPAEDTGQTWNLKFSYGVPIQASLYWAQLKPWAKAVEEATDGRVTIEHLSDGSLCSDEEEYDYLIDGKSDIAVVEPEYAPGVFNVLESASLPELFPDPAVTVAVMWDVAQEYCADELKDVKLLGFTCVSGAQYIGKNEVHVPTDIAGLRIRTGGKIESWMLEDLGAVPTHTESDEFGKALRDDIADGAFLSWSMMFISDSVRFSQYRTHLDLMYRPWLIIMNQDVWESMPPNIQDAVMSVSGQIPSVVYSIANEELTQQYRVDMTAIDERTGNAEPIYEPTEAELALWKDAAMKTWPMWIADLKASKSSQADKGQEIVDYILDKVAEYTTYYEDYLPDAQEVLDARLD